jgi:hypothetical protein
MSVVLLVCIGCGKTPSELPEYVDAARVEGMSPELYVWEEEGTLNRENGHFACDSCYIKMGQPSRRDGRWVAP